MGTPQQNELRRSDLGETHPEGRRKTREEESAKEHTGPSGPVPPENRPGHRPEKDQDKPEPPQERESGE